MHHLVETSAGPVEVVVTTEQDRGWVLYFHGGHESAVTASAARLYAGLGYGVLALSRPGYGATDVGPMSPTDFSVLADQVRGQFGHEQFLAVVGTSFGGPQAVAYAGQYPTRVRSLILHSAAPSSRAYPDKAIQRLLGPVVFHPAVERFTWKAVSLLMKTLPELGLRIMTAPLSTLPAKAWLWELSSTEQQAIRELFCEMRSGSGFNIDVQYSGRKDASIRRRSQQRVVCPTLVTASRYDAGVVWAHAEDFLATIPKASLIEIPAASHLFWIGPAKAQLLLVIREFLVSSVP